MEAIMETSFSTFYRILTSTNDIYQEMQRRSHPPSSEYWVMFSVYQDKCRFSHEICLVAFMSRQTVSLAVKKLMARGWISLIPSAESRRMKEIRTTEKGLAFAEKYIFPLGMMEEKAWNKLDAEEREGLIAASSRFQSYFKEEIDTLFKEDPDS